MRSQSAARKIGGKSQPIRVCFAALLALCGWALLNVIVSPHIALAEAQIQTGTTPTHAFLQIGNQVLLDRPGFHLSKPQRSPDGHWLAVTMVPIGTGTATLAETYLFATSAGQLLARLNGHSPMWSADSRQLQLENTQGSFVYYVTEQRLEQQSIYPRQLDEVLVAAGSLAPPTYPQTIRVAHHPSNGCRSVSAWQVDTISFEEYVARVLPAEVPASWPAAALEAMAVAARTYAWQQILAGRSEYDVTDWANFQMMCDEHYPSTDAAVATTVGQYLTAKDGAPGFPISAMYSAENGHPTLTNPNVTYLQAVPDLFSIGRERWGHGYGLSQWGAYRRARAGQNYRQILAHYYSRVYLQNGLNPGQVVGGLVGWLPQTGLATDGLSLRSLVPADVPVQLIITASAGLTAPVTFLGDEAIWRAASPLAENTQVTAQLWVQAQLADQLSLTIDRSAPPTPLLQTPEQLTQPLLAVTLPTLADGEYMLRAQAADLAGNVRTLRYPLRIDTMPPTMVIQTTGLAVNRWYSEPVTVALAATDNASGVAQIVYELLSPPATAQPAAQPYTRPMTLTTGGVHAITYWAVDQAGNVATRDTLTVALDLAAPVVLLNQFLLRANVTRVGWQITDDGTGVAEVEMQVQQGDGTWQAAPWDFVTDTVADITLDPERAMKVRARARDHFGRTSEWVTIELWHAAAWLYLPIVQQ